jgi:hypothetical protein
LPWTNTPNNLIEGASATYHLMRHRIFDALSKCSDVLELRRTRNHRHRRLACSGTIELVSTNFEPSLWQYKADIESCRLETGAKNASDLARNLEKCVSDTPQRIANSWEYRNYFFNTDMERRDRTGWLGRQDSNSEISWQNIPLKGHTDFQGSSRILATETIRV